jgi:hypothetical protein
MKSPSVYLSMTFRRLAGSSFRWQIILILALWAYTCGLHWSNDGLWYQGDSPRHAANGIFWKDYLVSLPRHPEAYALAYHARYPVISPTSYPPFFYLLEALAFSLLGPSPYISKSIVLCFSLVAAVFSTLWLRRWIAPDAGWGGGLVLLSPGVVSWSHAVMLNVPAFGLSMAALYSVRRWLETQERDLSSRWGYASVLFFALSALTYYPSLIVAFIAVAWLVYLRRWDLLFNRKIVTCVAIAALIFVPCFAIAWQWSRRYFPWVSPSWHRLFRSETWEFYPLHFTRLVHPNIGVLALAGLVIGWKIKRWQKETRLLIIWLIVTYLVFSNIEAREDRYILLVIPPLVCLSMIGLIGIVDWVTTRFTQRDSVRQAVAVALLLVVVSVQLWPATRRPVPMVSGFKEAALFFSVAAPHEPVLYDGYHDGVFTFYVLANDPQHRRQVVLAEKVLRATADEQSTQSGSISIQETINTIRSIGANWVAVEVNNDSGRIPPSLLLRQALLHGEFYLVRSFPLQNAGRLDVYRILPH